MQLTEQHAASLEVAKSLESTNKSLEGFSCHIAILCITDHLYQRDSLDLSRAKEAESFSPTLERRSASAVRKVQNGSL